MHVATCLLIAAALGAAAEDNLKLAERFAGQWVIRSIEINGAAEEARMPPDSALLTIRGDRIEFFMVNLAGSYEEKGGITVVGDGPDRFKVDVRVVEKSAGAFGRQPGREIVRKELWRITDGGKLQRYATGSSRGAAGIVLHEEGRRGWAS